MPMHNNKTEEIKMPMIFSRVHTCEEMIDYLIECATATIEGMIGVSRCPKYEFQRQCRIVQHSIDFLGQDFPFESRASHIVKSGKPVLQYYKDKRQKYLEDFKRYPIA